MKRFSKGRSIALGLCGSLLLAACGSSSRTDSTSPIARSPTSGVPDSATTTVAGLFTYLTALVGVSDDTLEPVATSTVTLMTDDTIEPSATI